MISILAFAAGLAAAPVKPDAAPPPVIVAPPLPIVRTPPPVPPPPSPPPPSAVEGPRARANLASYVSNDDYPEEALFNDEQGVVGFRLAVDPSGRVASCAVVSSSGAPSLDEVTCEIMKSRARFTPARDSRGNPVFDFVAGRIRWQIADDSPPEAPAAGDATAPPVISSAVRARPTTPLADLVTNAEYIHAQTDVIGPVITEFELAVGADGRVADCTIYTPSGADALDDQACRTMRERARFTPARDEYGNAVPDRHRGHLVWRPAVTPPPVLLRTAPPAN